MASIRVSPNATLTIVATSTFMMSLPDGATLSLQRGAGAATLQVNWMQGLPEIASVTAATFSLVFFTDSNFNTVLASGSDYSIGNQDLDEIVTVTGFTDDGSGSGHIDFNLDPSGITTAELNADTPIFVQLQVSQPDSDD